MTQDWKIGDKILHIPYYEWNKHEKHVGISEPADVREGVVIKKWTTIYGNGRAYPCYVVRYADGTVDECDGLNFVPAENKK